MASYTTSGDTINAVGLEDENPREAHSNIIAKTDMPLKCVNND